MSDLPYPTVDTRLPLAVVFLSFTFLPGPSALAQKVTIDFDKTADFSHIHRYQWRTHPIFEKHPELKERYATGIQLVLEAGYEQLEKKGLVPVESSPDIFVTFFLAAKEEQEQRTFVDPSPWWNTAYGWYGTPAWTQTEVENYTKGLLVLDIVDPVTSKLIWRAYCTDTIKDMRTRGNNINSAVRKAFDRFPPKK